MPAPHRPTPRWHPIASLPLIAPVIDGQLEGAEEQHRLLLQAKPGSLDDATVERVVQVFTEEVEFLVIYQEQLDRWRAEPLAIAQRREVDRLGRQVAQPRCRCRHPYPRRGTESDHYRCHPGQERP